MAAESGRDLLFGLLALQVGLIDQGQLVAAFQAWTRDKTRGLADHLCARGALDADRRGVIEALASHHLRKNANDPEKSLASLAVGRSTREAIRQLGDPEVDRSLEQVGSHSTENADPDSTLSYSIGSSTSDGQRFRVLRPHARGGLGAVFVALDGELNREVALKQILEAYADDPASRQRFLLEAEITGGLEHPGIVPVYGLGTYGAGRPYYAMRFIRGDNLKAAISEFHAGSATGVDPGRRSLAIRRLLRRFVDVCNAIDYAHGRGVLHRDIKPGNVIIGKHGETLVVDWGLAKAVGKGEPGASADERPLTPSSSSGSAETLPGSALGTPAYMSPEQARGDLDRLGPRSDVYSLGATLYCLLTGKPPFEGDPGEVLRKVQKGESPRPRELDPSIDRAMEAVCLKAMATDPGDRYPTARELADDVERWMAEEPVNAWHEPIGRRARRWANRNRTAMTAMVTAALVALVGAASVLVVQARANADLKEANRREKERFGLAMDAIKLFHGEVSEDVLLKESQFDGLRNKLLNAAAAFYRRLEGQLVDKTDRDSRAALGKAYHELGGLTGKIGDKTAALNLHRQALSVRRDLASGRPGSDPGATLDVARSLIEIGRWQSMAGDKAGALESCREARRLAEGLGSSGPGGESVRAVLGETCNSLGWVLAAMGKRAEAMESYERGLAIRRELADAHPQVDRFQLELCGSYVNIGSFLGDEGRMDEARNLFERGQAKLRALADSDPAATGPRWSLALNHNDLGRLLVNMGKPAEALVQHRQALAIRRGLADSNPTATSLQRDLAQSYGNIGIVLGRMDEPAGAVDAFRESLTILEKQSAANPTALELRVMLGYSLDKLGVALFESGRTEEALTSCRRAIAIMQTVAEAEPSSTEVLDRQANVLSDCAVMMRRAGRPAEALELYRQALPILQKAVDANPEVVFYQHDLAGASSAYGQLLWWTGRAAEAAVQFDRAREVAARLAEVHRDRPLYVGELANACANVAAVRLSLRRATEALEAADRAVSLREELVARSGSPVDRAGLGEALLRAGQSRLAQGNLADATVDGRRAAATFEAMPPRGGEQAFFEGCSHALLSALAGRPGSGVPPEDAEVEAAASLRLLRQAAESGFRDPGAYRTDPALDALRDRPDLRLLMLDLAMPTEPVACFAP